TARYGAREPMRVRRDGDAMALEIDLPFTDRDDLELGRTGDELLVRVGPYRRAVVLPDALRRRTVGAAALVDGRLTVTFVDPAAPRPPVAAAEPTEIAGPVPSASGA